ncbi:MAG: hypothetical protein ABH883_07695, partial [Candidatus Omnitrophota bacterium]
MNFIKRVFLFLYFVLMVCAGAFFVVLSSGFVSVENWTDLFDLLHESFYTQIALAVIGAVFIVIGL